MKTLLIVLWILLVSFGSTWLLLEVVRPQPPGPQPSFLYSAVATGLYFFADFGVLLVTLGVWRRRGLRAALMLLVPVVLVAGVAAGAQYADQPLVLRLLRGLLVAGAVAAVLAAGLWPIRRYWRSVAPPARDA